jgi:hypothetical protein
MIHPVVKIQWKLVSNLHRFLGRNGRKDCIKICIAMSVVKRTLIMINIYFEGTELTSSVIDDKTLKIDAPLAPGRLSCFSHQRHPLIYTNVRMRSMGVWQGVPMDSLKFHLGPPYLNLLRPAGEPPLNRPYGHFRGGPPIGREAYDRILPLWTPHALRL